MTRPGDGSDPGSGEGLHLRPRSVPSMSLFTVNEVPSLTRHSWWIEGRDVKVTLLVKKQVTQHYRVEITRNIRFVIFRILHL